MSIDIRHFFLKVLTNSMDTPQVNYLGEKLDSKFNIYSESGFHLNSPLPRKTAADVLLNYFKTEEEIVRLFTIMLENEGTRFYNATLNVWGKEDFINILKMHKWIFDSDLKRFFLDPFYEHEINFLKSIRIIDLRHGDPTKEIITGIEKAITKLKVQDIEWRVTLRLYDLEPHISELVRKIISLLLARQNLQIFTHEMYACLKELALNASKANYKLLYEKHVTRQQGVTADGDYFYFLRLFQSEIEQNRNTRLLEFARQDDRFINITFQSSNDSIAIWVTNNQNISIIERQEILRRMQEGGFEINDNFDEDDEYAEGAGFGLKLILSILRNYSKDKEPLKVIFYPDYIKMGFELSRSELLERYNSQISKEGNK